MLILLIYLIVLFFFDAKKVGCAIIGVFETIRQCLLAPFNNLTYESIWIDLGLNVKMKADNLDLTLGEIGVFVCCRLSVDKGSEFNHTVIENVRLDNRSSDMLRRRKRDVLSDSYLLTHYRRKRDALTSMSTAPTTARAKTTRSTTVALTAITVHGTPTDSSEINRIQLILSQDEKFYSFHVSFFNCLLFNIKIVNHPSVVSNNLYPIKILKRNLVNFFC